uniref:Uncharacterized protein n=1 Tax=Tanacetum cinerariifolium TaxID=118510 RepID=A0A6L2KDP3_TANCI|nr:hypothetical protein [Tanacetum cinerariifolium]
MYVPEPEYPKYLEPPGDDIVAEDQPHADDVVPTALSSGYIFDSDLKEDPNEEKNADYANEPEEEDPKEEDPKEEDPEEEESDDNTASEEEPSEGFDDTEPSKPSEEDETAARVAELLDMPTPPPSPLTPMSSPLPQIPSPSLHVPSPPPIPSLPLPQLVHIETHAPEQDVAAALLMFEVGESSVAATAKPPIDLYGFVDTTEAKASITHRHARTLHDSERKMMTTVELINMRVSYEAQTLPERRSEARNESVEAHNRSLVARIETIETRRTEMED